jgi:ParB family chromosome partitioning protein
MGHAKALVAVSDRELQCRLFSEIISQDLSVRKVEERAREFQNKTAQPEGKVKAKTSAQPDEYEALQVQLSGIFKSKVKLKKMPQGKGEIVIPFATEEEFERLISIIEKIQS